MSRAKDLRELPLSIDVTPSGAVGIGTSSPSQKLHIEDTTSANTSTYIQVVSGNTGNAGIAFGDSDADLRGGVLYNNNDNALRFFKSGFSEAMRIDSNGNVGIGTDDPAHKFHINQPGNSPQMRISGNANWDFYSYNDTNFYVNNASGTVLGLLGNRDAYFSKNLSVGDSVLSTYHTNYPAVDIGSSASVQGYTGNNGAWLQSNLFMSVGGQWTSKSDDFSAMLELYDGNFNFYNTASGTGTRTLLTPMTIRQSGNVGIGETSPNQPLVVKRATDGAVIVANTAQAGGQGIGFFTDTANNRVGVFNNSSSTLDMVFNTQGIGTAGEAMRIDNATKNVGIGTTSPQGILHAHQNNTRLILSADTANQAAQHRIEFWETAATATAAYANFAIEYDGTTSYGGDGALLFKGSASAPISTQNYVFGGISRTGTTFFMNKFGIGNTDPQRQVHIGAANNTNHDAVIVLNNGGATGNRAGIEWRYEGITAPRARLSINASTIELEADINGNKVASFDTDGLKMTAGKGIKFSPYTSGNILDDYEEGGWTPNVYGESSAGTISYSHRSGWFRKIGDVVVASLNVAFTRSGGSGRMLISGLPYASNEESVGSFQANDMDGWQTAVGQYTSIIQSNESYIHMRGTRNDGNGFHYLQLQPMSYCRITITYKTS